MISTSWTRTWTSALIASLVLLAGAPALADPEAEARHAVEETTTEVLALLGDEALDNATRIERLTEVAERRFDLNRMGKLILGRNRRKLTEQQQAQFLDEWRRHLTVTYGDSLESFSDEHVDILSTRPEHNGDVTVKTAIVGGAAGSGIAVDYRMRPGEGVWRVLDIFIEGVSLVQSFRAQVQEIVSNEGPERLITILREKNDAKEASRAGS